jgi:hypothetical protein
MNGPEDGLRLGNIVRATGQRLLGKTSTIMNVEDLLARMNTAGIAAEEIADAKTFFRTLTHRVSSCRRHG